MKSETMYPICDLDGEEVSLYDLYPGELFEDCDGALYRRLSDDHQTRLPNWEFVEGAQGDD